MKEYMLPPVGTKGVFIFNPPYDRKEIDNKEYEVVEIRTIKSIYDDGKKPLENIYLANGLTKDNFQHDLENEIPIITLYINESSYLYVPANRIKKMPTIVGYTATERLITLSLGLIPDDVNLVPLLENIKTLINDTISVVPKLIEQPGGPTVLMSNEDYKDFLKMMNSQARSANKSYRIMYIEEVERNRLLKRKLEEVNTLIVKAYQRQ